MMVFLHVCMFIMWTKCMWRTCIGVHHVHTVPVEVMYVCVSCIHSAYEDLYVCVLYACSACGGHVCMCNMYSQCLWRTVCMCTMCIQCLCRSCMYMNHVYTVPMECHVCICTMCRDQKSPKRSSRWLVTKPRFLTETAGFLTTEPSFQSLVCFKKTYNQ